MATTFLVVRDVALRVGLAPSTLAKLRIKGGGPPFVKLGKKVVYPEAELEIWQTEKTRFVSTAQGTTRRPNAGRKQRR